ncbi:probable NADH dehydrogenase [ubiquinone] 1 alpha subcomplex subunit [Coccomyxa sp. Obi]|nr:probable NADH dehydrogenase [ubiquinone] 1 alpha subcomplex subunit [Coccomyxa sp. Obi]
MALVKFLKDTYKRDSVLDALKAGGWKAFLDGTLAQTTLVHGPNATLVGSDGFGNKYYERMTEQYGRHRWVVFGDLDWPSGQESSTVPPEWHGWLHCITDSSPATADVSYPIYHVPHHANKTGTPSSYAPKGAWQNPSKRSWKKVQAWDPASAAASA